MSKLAHINSEIRAATVRVISETGGQLGIFPLNQALAMAK
ncbi:MAG: translation initiation factor IF-3, partial [Deltaproteobacteria bacterium]|nr:translation initiation factor IF-3 [Deltaproteobacteria bacterium]